MKAIITGASGAVGRALTHHLHQHGVTVLPWDRRRVHIDTYWEMEEFVRDEAPDVLFHLATDSQPLGITNESWHVNYEWTSELAWICGRLDVRFVYTSSVAVFSDDARGPFYPDSPPDASQGYGYVKLAAEERAFFQNPNAVVARLGWQIGREVGSNNMVDQLEVQMTDYGIIPASTRWLPACAFLEDTADALWRLALGEPGLYLLDSNRGWNYYQIAQALNERHGRRWQIEPTDDFIFDQRMIDPRAGMPPLNQRLTNLPPLA
jgi:dTDP-4-dehydrorhamnose reductase